MCGILVSACLVEDGQNTDFPDLFDKLQAANAPRGEFMCIICSCDVALMSTFAQGPDAQSLHHIALSCAQVIDGATSEISNDLLPHLSLAFFASELRLRGNRPVVQPHKQDGDVLCWNGEVRQKFLRCKPIHLNQ